MLKIYNRVIDRIVYYAHLTSANLVKKVLKASLISMYLFEIMLLVNEMWYMLSWYQRCIRSKNFVAIRRQVCINCNLFAYPV